MFRSTSRFEGRASRSLCTLATALWPLTVMLLCVYGFNRTRAGVQEGGQALPPLRCGVTIQGRLFSFHFMQLPCNPPLKNHNRVKNIVNVLLVVLYVLACFDLVNVTKCQMLGKAIGEVIRFQRVGYDIKPNTDVINWLGSLAPKTDDEIYEMSLQQEPREEPGKPRSVLKKSKTAPNLGRKSPGEAYSRNRSM